MIQPDRKETMDYILKTDHMTKMYGKKAAVKDVNLHIGEGQIYGLIGRNGAGKTTIMRILSGLAVPTSGDYSLFGQTGMQRKKMLRQVGVLIEYPGLYPKLSAYENLKIKCIAMGIRSDGYIDGLLETVGLQNTDRKKPAGSFSLGMRQRLGIALALVGDPKLLILDEPINGLDPQGIADIRETLVRLRDEKGITIMISSHILDELSKVADFYGIIHEGTLLDEFSSEQLHSRSGRYVTIRTDNVPETIRVLNMAGFQNVSKAPDGSIRVDDKQEQTDLMAKVIVNAGISLKEIFLNTRTLEDYYLGVTGGTNNE